MLKNTIIAALSFLTITTIVELKITETRLEQLDAFVRTGATLSVDADTRLETRIRNLERRP